MILTTILLLTIVGGFIASFVGNIPWMTVIVALVALFLIKRILRRR